MPTEANIRTLFDAHSEWEHAPAEICHYEKFHPNQLAYHERSATLALIVKRSITGEDFALCEAGLLLIEAALEKGERKNGKPVKVAWIVLADMDRSSQRLRAISHSTAQEIREQVKGIDPYPGKYGPFWWIKAPPISGSFSNETW